MRNIALFLTYLGTRYHGWQVQKNLPTVAETLEKAAAQVVPQRPRDRLRPDGRGSPRPVLCGEFPNDFNHSGGAASLCAEYPSAL